MDKETARFRVLLAEDDLVSREFLCEAIRTCGGEPVACADGPEALAQARAGHWNLLILDHQLPGMNGEAVLAALRRDHIALPPALATTAEPDGVSTMLLEAGFAQVLPKPLRLEVLQDVLAQLGCQAGMLDDDDALRACGSHAAVERLRRLFAEQELPHIQDAFDRSAGDPRTLRPTLHRLLASCGFCGASALAGACSALQNALASSDDHRIAAARDRFAKALQETRAMLHARLCDRP